MEPRGVTPPDVISLPEGNVNSMVKKEPNEQVVTEWKNAPAEIVEYESGFVRPEGDSAYRYEAGRRLIIKNELVMDTCEGPWGQAVVDAAFDHEAIAKLDRTKTLRVLERGAGLNIAGTRIIDRLIGRGSGEYHVIELNDDVANLAEAWKQDMEEAIRKKGREQGLKYNIKIFIHRGEAREVSKQLAEKGEKFNIIISDTYPLDESETGTNDIEDIEVIKNLLYRNNGVFAFFSYFPGMDQNEGQAGFAVRQLSKVKPHFVEAGLKAEAMVKPPQDYTYLFRDGKPVRSLPVVICSDKR